MALLVEQLQWSEPLTPEIHDPAWEAEVRGFTGGFLPGSVTRVASSPWVRRAYLDCVRMPIETPGAVGGGAGGAGDLAGERLPLLLRLGPRADEDDRIFGRDDRPHRAQRAARRGRAARARAGAVLSQPRAVQAAPEPGGAREDARGRLQPRCRPRSWRWSSRWSASATASRRCWRCRPSSRWRREARGSRGSGTSCRPGSRASSRCPCPPPDYPPPTFEGPFGSVVRALEGLPAAAMLEVILNSAFSSEVLPRRTLNLIFAVIAHTLQCQLCETDAANLLDVDGFSRARARARCSRRSRRRASPTMEALLIPWARDTVWMPEQPARIQERTRPLLDALGPEVLVEAVGGRGARQRLRAADDAPGMTAALAIALAGVLTVLAGAGVLRAAAARRRWGGTRPRSRARSNVSSTSSSRSSASRRSTSSSSSRRGRARPSRPTAASPSCSPTSRGSRRCPSGSRPPRWSRC